MENTPEERVVSWLLLRDEEQMKMKMREREGERNEMRKRNQIVKTFKNT